MGRPSRWALAGVALIALGGCFGKSRLGVAQTALPDAGSDLITGQVCPATVDPGRVTLHRLNRAEYNNTLRDLLGDTTGPARDFPNDDTGYGFDNNADVLSLAPLLLEKYDNAAELLVDTAWANDGTPGQTTRVPATSATASVGSAYGTSWNLFSNGGLSTVVTFATDGAYTLSARAFGQQAGPDPARMQFTLDSQMLKLFDVTAVEAAPAIYSQTVAVTAGPHTFRVDFVNDYYDPTFPDPTKRDRNLIVDWLQVDLPSRSVPPGQARLRICDPAVDGADPCARKILTAFVRRAWRRPVDPAELDRLAGQVSLAAAQGDSFDVGIKLALHTVLLSPHFLFRVELDPDPTSATPHPLTDLELAARLSYFLWSSTPDAELSARADDGSLHQPPVLDAQVRRMLADPRSDALVQNFAGQWLQTRAIDDVKPDATLFPKFDAALAASMKTESQLTFRAFLDGDRSALDLLDANFTYVDARLASHYGMPAPSGTGFLRVDTQGTHRGGLLTQASFLTLTSHANRTSPVKRGKWVMGKMLCTEPAPPPPGIPPLVEPPNPTTSLRQRMEAHRANPVCASCHATMDPIGFGLENFDAIGQWRTVDADGFPVDATGSLPGKQAFNGPTDLAGLLKRDPRVSGCMVREMFVYALGRGDSPRDVCALDSLTQQFDGQGQRLSKLVSLIAGSAPFTQRRGEPGGGP